MSDEIDEGKIGDSREYPEHKQTESAHVKASYGSTSQLNPTILLLFMILTMLVVLAITSLRLGKGMDKTPDDPTVIAIKADMEARRTELNRQRIAMGLSPLKGAPEPVEDIAKRLKADADTLAGISGRFQQMLADKDSIISNGNVEQAGAVSKEDFADLQRRYEEVLRAKEFFEERVRTLESAAP